MISDEKVWLILSYGQAHMFGINIPMMIIGMCIPS